MAATATTDKIAAALANGQTRTALDISASAGLGFSTVGKALAAMEKDGTASRTRVDGKSFWTLATESTDADVAAEDAEVMAAEAAAATDEDARTWPPAVLADAPVVEAAKPSQDDKILAALGMTESELAIDVVHTMHTVGATVEMTDTMTIPANGPIIGDLVAVYAHQRVRVARVWAVTPTKLSAVYTTPSEVDAAARVNRAASWNNITAKIAECGLVRSAVVAEAAPVADEAPADDEATEWARQADVDAETDRVADEATIAALTPAQRRALIAMHRAGLGDMLTARAARAAAKVAAPKAKTPRAAVANGTLPAMNRGGLRAEVVAHLTANPTVEVTPSKLAKALGGRSSGAVANALVKLVEAGTVVQTSDAPRTYRLA